MKMWAAAHGLDQLKRGVSTATQGSVRRVVTYQDAQVVLEYIGLQKSI